MGDDGVRDGAVAGRSVGRRVTEETHDPADLTVGGQLAEVHAVLDRSITVS